MSLAEVGINVLIALLTGMATGLVAGIMLHNAVKKREEQLWLPSKHLLHHRLFQATDELLIKVLPPDCVDIVYYFYWFGNNTRLLSNMQIKNRNHIRALMRSRREGVQDFGLGMTSDSKLLEIDAEVKDIVKTPTPLSEPELMEKVLELQRVLSKVVDAVKLRSTTLADFDTLDGQELEWRQKTLNNHTSVVDRRYGELAVKATEIRDWLERNAVTSRVSHEEDLRMRHEQLDEHLKKVDRSKGSSRAVEET